jgi:hypothetical protein
MFIDPSSPSVVHRLPCYGYYSNVCHGRRQKKNQDALIRYILEPDEDSKVYRKIMAGLIEGPRSNLRGMRSLKRFKKYTKLILL